MIAGLPNKMICSLHAQNEIKTAGQPRGKVVGTDRIGSQAINRRENDFSRTRRRIRIPIRMLAIGGLENRWPGASLISARSRRAAGPTPLVTFKADANGLSELPNQYRHPPYQNVGTTARKNEAQEKIGRSAVPCCALFERVF